MFSANKARKIVKKNFKKEVDATIYFLMKEISSSTSIDGGVCWYPSNAEEVINAVKEKLNKAGYKVIECKDSSIIIQWS